MKERTALAWAASLGATGVALGAFGAHGLKGTLEAAGTLEVWKTAAHYQLLHACALLGFAAWMKSAGRPPGSRSAWTVRLWIAGTVLFSGSLYLLCLGGPRWLGPVTPLGGACLIAGWVAAALAAFEA
jgi:uncharacterized membrane protein YgdD (TMEM256/DUF423 family)